MPRYTITPIYWRDGTTVQMAMLVTDNWDLLHERAYRIPSWTTKTPFAKWCERANITPDQVELAPPRLMTAAAVGRLTFG